MTKDRYLKLGSVSLTVYPQGQITPQQYIGKSANTLYNAVHSSCASYISCFHINFTKCLLPPLVLFSVVHPFPIQTAELDSVLKWTPADSPFVHCLISYRRFSEKHSPESFGHFNGSHRETMRNTQEKGDNGRGWGAGGVGGVLMETPVEVKQREGKRKEFCSRRGVRQ